MAHRKHRKGRSLTSRDREIFRRNSLKGTREWERMSHAARERARARKAYRWGFNGRSPHTYPRKHKHKKHAW